MTSYSGQDTPALPNVLWRGGRRHPHEREEHLPPRPLKEDPEWVIVDTDPGIDDMMALMMILAAHKRGEVRVLALTLTIGNSDDLDVLARNACFALHVAGLSEDILVVKGAGKPMLTEYHGHSGKEVHGSNALGGVPLPFEPSKVPLGHAYGSAAEYIAATCAAHPGKVTLVALGPLVNLGLAVTLDPVLPTNVRRVVLMGGCVFGGGNKAASAEANIHNDPDAAALVFQSFPDITMAGLNVTGQVELSEEFRERIRSTCGDVGRFLFAITQHYVDLLLSWDNGVIAVHDSSAIMALLHPEIYAGSRVRVEVETKGELTKGTTVADWRGHWGKPPQTLVLQKVNEARFHDLHLGYLQEFVGVDFAALASSA